MHVSPYCTVWDLIQIWSKQDLQILISLTCSLFFLVLHHFPDIHAVEHGSDSYRPSSPFHHLSLTIFYLYRRLSLLDSSRVPQLIASLHQVIFCITSSTIYSPQLRKFTLQFSWMSNTGCVQLAEPATFIRFNK